MPAQPNPHSSGPYRFDGWAGPEFTVTRPETGALIALVEDGRRVYIDGPRRCGKTTLAINALAEVGLKALKIDLEGVCSKSGLVDRVATETYGFIRDNPAVEKALSGKRGVKASAEGNVLSVLKFSLESSSENDRKGPTTLSDLLSAVTTVARVAKAAVIVDEFQAANHPQLVNASEVVGDFASASDPLRTKNEVAWLVSAPIGTSCTRFSTGPAARFSSAPSTSGSAPSRRS
jgi:AAA+ ATPase superfamily predicted ATPase